MWFAGVSAACWGVSGMAGEAHVGAILLLRAAFQLAEAREWGAAPSPGERPAPGCRRKVKSGYFGQKTTFQPGVTMQI